MDINNLFSLEYLLGEKYLGYYLDDYGRIWQSTLFSSAAKRLPASEWPVLPPMTLIRTSTIKGRSLSCKTSNSQ